MTQKESEMSDVAAFAIVRQGDRKKAIPARDKAVVTDCASIARQCNGRGYFDVELFLARRRLVAL